MNIALELLAWSEMIHITMIDSCLLGRFPEVLCQSVFRSQIPPLKRALEYLSSLSVAEQPFAKILYPQEETSASNRRNRYFWADLAVEIFKKTSQSAINFTSAPDKNRMVGKGG